MPTYTLCLLNKNYSSWSCRALLTARHVKLPLEVEMFYMDDPNFKQKIQKFSPTLKAPALKVTEDSGHSYIIWDSLAILEYLAELHPEIHPTEREERAIARSVAAEMHSGFPKIREKMPYNVRARKDLTLDSKRDEELQNEIRRIVQIWEECRLRTLKKKSSDDEGFLFGKFTIADAMYFPICYRFRTYNIPIENGYAKKYMETIFNWPLGKELEQEAEQEDHIVALYEYI
ncbi:glutathione S-transferase, partial [Basidiobolus meristosporus CBS 931.73]